MNRNFDEGRGGHFRLLSYESNIASVDFGLSTGDPEALVPAVSIIIGPNGSGKSTVLAEIVNEFIFLKELISKSNLSEVHEKGPDHAAGDVKVSYDIGNDRCDIVRNGSTVSARVNKVGVSLRQIPFPAKLLAVAHLPVDKFRFSRNEGESFYSYLGLRQATNLTTTGALERKVITSLIAGQARSSFTDQIIAWSKLLGLEGPTALRFVASRMLLESESFEHFVNAAYDSHARRAGSRRQRTKEAFMRQYANDLDDGWLLLKNVRHARLVGQGSLRATYLLELAPFLFEHDYSPEAWTRGLEAARRLSLFVELALMLRKNGEFIDFSQMSSGEQQIIGTMTRLLAELEPNSLVVIDEPEVSLHPSWQMRYIPTLQQTLSSHLSTHVLIATHSHFLVSDVAHDNCSLIVASMKNRPVFTVFDGDVYGRSPENILYRVFGVGGSGNFYVERDLSKGLEMVSRVRETDVVELKAIVERLTTVAGPDNEALSLIIIELKRHLREFNNEEA